MKRGVLLAAAAALLITIGSIHQSVAQTKMPRVGIMSNIPKEHWYNEVFERALAAKGWIDGKNVLLEYRLNRGDAVQMETDIAELMSLKVDLIYCLSAPALRAAYSATKSIPIVGLDFTSDPVTAGYADSYSHPGRNVTGVFLDAPEIAGKWLELIKLVMPKLSRVMVVWDPAPGKTHLHAVQTAARSLGIKVQVLEVHTIEDIDKAFAKTRGQLQAAILLPSPLGYTHGARIAESAKKHRWLTAALWPEFAKAGGALGYGPEPRAVVERNAAQMAAILSGAKPGDLPIERPAKFQFIANAKTIKALGLPVLDEIVIRADKTIR